MYQVLQVLHYPQLIDTVDVLLEKMTSLPKTTAARKCIHKIDRLISEYMRINKSLREPFFDRFWLRLTEYHINDVQHFDDIQGKISTESVGWISRTSNDMQDFLLEANNRWFKNRKLLVQIVNYGLEIFKATSSKPLTSDIALKRAVAHRIIRSTSDSLFSSLLQPIVDDCTPLFARTFISFHSDWSARFCFKDVLKQVIPDLARESPPLLKPSVIIRRSDHSLARQMSPEVTRTYLSTLKAHILDESEDVAIRRLMIDSLCGILEDSLDHTNAGNPFEELTIHNVGMLPRSMKDSAMIAWFFEEILSGGESCFLLRLLAAPDAEIPCQLIPAKVFGMIRFCFSFLELLPGLLDILDPLVKRLCYVGSKFALGTVGVEDEPEIRKWTSSTTNKSIGALCIMADVLARQQTRGEASIRKQCANGLVAMEKHFAQYLLRPLIDQDAKPKKDKLPEESKFTFAEMEDQEFSDLFDLAATFLRHLPAEPSPNQHGHVLFSHPAEMWLFFEILALPRFDSDGYYVDEFPHASVGIFLVSGGAALLNEHFTKNRTLPGPKTSLRGMRKLFQLVSALLNANEAAISETSTTMIHTSRNIELLLESIHHFWPTATRLHRDLITEVLGQLLMNDNLLEESRLPSWRIFWTCSKLNPTVTLSTADSISPSWFSWWKRIMVNRIAPEADPKILERIGEEPYYSDDEDEPENESPADAKVRLAARAQKRMRNVLWDAASLVSYRVFALGMISVLKNADEATENYAKARVAAITNHAVATCRRIAQLEDFLREQREKNIVEGEALLEKIRVENEKKLVVFRAKIDERSAQLKYGELSNYTPKEQVDGAAEKVKDDVDAYFSDAENSDASEDLTRSYWSASNHTSDFASEDDDDGEEEDEPDEEVENMDDPDDFNVEESGDVSDESIPEEEAESESDLEAPDMVDFPHASSPSKLRLVPVEPPASTASDRDGSIIPAKKTIDDTSVDSYNAEFDAAAQDEENYVDDIDFEHVRLPSCPLLSVLSLHTCFFRATHLLLM
jgi:hypothetical protein